MPSDMGFGVSVTGFDEMQAELEALSKGLSKRTASKALRAGARVVKAAIESRVPTQLKQATGDSLPVGAMANDINLGNVRTIANGQSYSIDVGPGKYTAHVARWVEYGHQLIHREAIGDKGRHKPKGRDAVPAYPFLRPAWEESQEAAGAAVIAVIDEAMAKADLTKDDIEEVA